MNTMNCSVCGNPTKSEKSKFCSNECKFASFRKKDVDPNKRVRCKIDGKEFKDYTNSGHTLSNYSTKVLFKEFDWNDWEVFELDVKVWKCPYCKWSCKNNAGGSITTHIHDEHGLLPEQHCESYPDDRSLWIEYWKHYNNKSFKYESEDNRVQCLECGEFFSRVNNRHLMDKHGMTLQEYDSKYPDADRLSTTSKAKAQQQYDANGKLYKRK